MEINVLAQEIKQKTKQKQTKKQKHKHTHTHLNFASQWDREKERTLLSAGLFLKCLGWAVQSQGPGNQLSYPMRMTRTPFLNTLSARVCINRQLESGFKGGNAIQAFRCETQTF